jgi:transcriptional regulator with XRE-family HTH domain
MGNGVFITGHVGNSFTAKNALPSTGKPGLFRRVAKGRPPKANPGDRPAWAQRILEARVRAGLSQTQLAEQIGRSQSTIADYETGASEPDFATLERIGVETDVTAAWIAFGVGDPDQGDGFSLGSFERHKHDRLFVFAFSQAAKVFYEEGLQADLSFLIKYTLRLLRMAKTPNGGAQAEDRIREAMDTEREEVRAELKAILDKRT